HSQDEQEGHGVGQEARDPAQSLTEYAHRLQPPGPILAHYHRFPLKERAAARASPSSPASSTPAAAPTRPSPARRSDQTPRPASPCRSPYPASLPQVGRFEGSPSCLPKTPRQPPRWPR